MQDDRFEGSPWPIGTPAEVVEMGLSLKRRHTCAKPDPDNDVKGCTQWHTCQFNMARRGAFKGQGPRYVGYRLVTDRAENNQAKHDICACYVFVETIQNRMIGAQHNKDLGRDHESVAIIAQEGQKMTMERWLPVNLRGEVIHQPPSQQWIIDGLREAKIPLNLDDTNPAHDCVPKTFDVVIPKHPRPKDMASVGFQAKIIADEMAANRSEDEREMRLWEMEQKEKADDISPDDDELDMSLAEKPRGRRATG